jgi:phytoene dehydrogenase-like protein
MASPAAYDAVVVGAGPNGLAAAITLARAGRHVLVREACDTIGGGTRTRELTLPGYQHDVCSAVHPLAVASPFFRHLPLRDYGLEFVYPPSELAHPLDDGSAVMVERSLEATGRSLGEDAEPYRRLLAPYVRHWQWLLDELLGPFPFPPRHPLLLARFGTQALWPATWLGPRAFRTERGQAVFAGVAAHSMLPLDAPITAAFGIMLSVPAHAVGWPVVKGGSQRITEAMAAYFRTLGGEIVTGAPVTRLDELPGARQVLFDLTPRQIIQIAGDQLPSGYVRRLQRFRYGPGVFKMDWALDGPIPWRAPEVARAATVHIGGTLREIAAGERAVARGEHPERPFILLAQPSLFDSTRAPKGGHTVWAYCHVPHGSTVDMSARIEAQIERFAPGFRDRILARSVKNSEAMAAYNANYIGGDINGGLQDWRQLFTRPVNLFNPYATPNPRLFICSSSTPPGGGVHGMCGHHAAHAALRAAP